MVPFYAPQLVYDERFPQFYGVSIILVGQNYFYEFISRKVPAKAEPGNPFHALKLVGKQRSNFVVRDMNLFSVGYLRRQTQVHN